MGAEQSKTRSKLAEIDREVTSIRSSLRGSNRSLSKEEKNNLQENLVKYSNEVSELKGKVKNRQLDVSQKNISQTMREVLTMDSDLDNAAVETDSIVQVSQNKKSSSLDRTKNNTKAKNQSKSMPSLTNIPTLQDIENKLKTLKGQIKVALESEDTTLLRVHQETLKVLATSLELIDTSEYTPLDDKKKKLDSSVMAQYQKINKALREIRRNRDIKYLSKQKQREDIMRELEIISREIDKFDTLSREAFKAGDIVSIRDVHQNLKNINRRLSSIESVDENTKTLKLQMKDKISWLGKYINESAFKGSQSTITRAQTDYEELIKNIASGKSEDESQLKEKLESLQNFTSLINSNDQDEVKRKRQLLTNINKSLTALNEITNDVKNNTVDIGVLERTVFFDKKLLDDFVNAWDILENALLKSYLPKQTIKQVDDVLSDVQTAMEKARKSLINFNRNQKKSNQILSASVPNLTDKEEYLFNNERSTKKIYLDNEKSTEDLNKIIENGHKDERRFSRINEIKTQVYYIKEKFETSIQKPNLKTKLEAYIKTLHDYAQSENQVIANSAKILLTEVNDIIKNIDRTMSSHYEKLPLDYYNDIISRIQQNVAELEKTAKHFQADGNDTAYQETKKLLNEGRNYLETIDIPQEYDSVESKRIQLLEKIHKIITDCERENSIREEAYVRVVRNTLNNLKDKINRFSGPYKGVVYNAIEKDLNKILIHADANIVDKTVSEQITKDTEKFLKILEHRAMKDQSFKQPKAKGDTEKMSAIKEELQTIKNDMDATPINAINIFIGLNSRLDLIKLSLDQLKNLEDNIEHQREIIQNEIETLKHVVEAKVALGQQDINQTSLDEFKKRATEENDRRITEELDKVELTFGKLKNDIVNFVGTKSNRKYYELDESIMRLIVKLDDLKLSKDTALFDRKVKLLSEIHRYEDVLDKRINETEVITQFERDIADIQNNFSRHTKSIKDLENIGGRIKELKINLEHGEFGNPLRQRKQSCMEMMDDMETRIETKTKENVLNQEHLLQLKYNLEVINNSIQKQDVSSTEVVERLSTVRVALENMQDLSSANLEQRTQLLKQLESMEKALESKLTKTQTSVTGGTAAGMKDVKNKADKELLEIEQVMQRLKNEIGCFIGTSKDEKFCELDERINKLIMKLDDMKSGKESSYYEKKISLMKTLNNLSELLDKRADDTEIILEFEHEVASIQRDITKHSSDTVERKIGEIEKTELVDDLNDRKTSCVEKLRKLLCTQKTANITATISTIKDKCEEIEKQIDEFDGISSDSIYLDIESNLQKFTKVLLELPSLVNSEEDQKKDQLLEQIGSSRSFLVNKARENKIYKDFIAELDEIKKKINATSNRDSMKKMHSKLKFIQGDVEKAPVKEKLKNDIHRKCTLLLQSYSDKLNSLPDTNYIGSLAFLQDLETSSGVKSKPPVNNFQQQYESFLKLINEKEKKVEEFTGNEESEDYKSLEDEILKINVRVKKLNDLSIGENIKQKVELKGKIVNCLTKLDENIQNFETYVEIEKELDGLGKRLKRALSQEEKDDIDEKLISLQLKVGKLINLNTSLLEKKKFISQRILVLMRKIKESISNSHSEDSGTSI